MQHFSTFHKAEATVAPGLTRPCGFLCAWEGLQALAWHCIDPHTVPGPAWPCAALGLGDLLALSPSQLPLVGRQDQSRALERGRSQHCSPPGGALFLIHSPPGSGSQHSYSASC